MRSDKNKINKNKNPEQENFRMMVDQKYIGNDFNHPAIMSCLSTLDELT